MPPSSRIFQARLGRHDLVSELALGVDIGGVVLRHDNYQEDASRAGPLLGPGSELPGAREGIAALTSVFGGRVYLVSKCGPLTQARTREWLAEGFYDSTGLDPAAVRFCRRRSDKAGICADLGITHFVDDRLEVLSYLEAVPNRYLFRPRADEVAAHHSSLGTADLRSRRVPVRMRSVHRDHFPGAVPRL
jgi:hypothetical protein